MLGHRPLNADDYIAILKRRGWMIAAPVILLPLIAFAITFFIAPEYLSQTLVLIEEQKVPDEYVKPVISSDLDSRLASMKEQILSRSRIEPIITRYNLYGNTHMSLDDRIDLARKSIDIKPIHSEIAHSGGLPGFYIAFRAGDPHTAQLVCTEITSLFVSENLRSREASAMGTTDFLKGQLADAKRNLDEQDAKLAAFQRQYIGKLPGESAPNVNMLTSLNTQLEAATQALARMEQDRTYEEAMLAQQAQTTAPSVAAAAAAAPQTQQIELQSLLAQESDLAAHYTADHPDVIAVRRKIADLRKKIAQTPATPASAPSALSSAPSRYDSPAVQQLRAQLRAAQIGIEAKRKEQAQIQANVRLYQDRIQSSPLVEEQYKELTRDNTTAQTIYDNLLTEMNHAKMATDLEHRQQGEQFKIMDGANLPDSPFWPRRNVFALAGLALGALIGFALVGFIEYKDTTLRTDRDVAAFTRLSTLAIIAFAGDLEEANPAKSKPRKPKNLNESHSKPVTGHA